MSRIQSHHVFLGFAAVLLVSGCVESKLSDDLAAARAEAAAVRAEHTAAKAEIEALRVERTRLKSELERLSGKNIEPEEPALHQKIIGLKANYDKSAITLDEWTKLKQRLIDQIPSTTSPSEKGSRG